MENEHRTDKIIYGRTRKEACNKVALDFIERQAPALANHMSILLAQERQVQNALITMYAKGHLDGFAMALELILNGTINLQEILTSIHDSEQEQDNG